MSFIDQLKQTLMLIKSYRTELISNLNSMLGIAGYCFNDNSEASKNIYENLMSEQIIAEIIYNKINDINTIANEYNETESYPDEILNKIKKNEDNENNEKNEIKKNWKQIALLNTNLIPDNNIIKKNDKETIKKRFLENSKKTCINDDYVLEKIEKSIKKKKKKSDTENSIIVKIDEKNENEIFYDDDEENMKNSNEKYLFFEIMPKSPTRNNIANNNNNNPFCFDVKSEDFEAKKQNRKRRGPYNILDSNDKTKAILDVKNGMDEDAVAKKYKISKKNLKRWLATGGGRKILDPQMERDLLIWWLETVKKEEKAIPLSMVKKKARTLSHYPKNFKASKGWLDKYSKRHKIDQKIEEIVNKKSEMPKYVKQEY